MHAKDRALSSAGGSSAKSAGARASVRSGASGACAGSAGAGAFVSTSASGAGARRAVAGASATTSAFGATAGSARGQASASTSAGGASARSAGGGGLCEHQRERSKCKACREDADEAGRSSGKAPWAVVMRPAREDLQSSVASHSRQEVLGTIPSVHEDYLTKKKGVCLAPAKHATTHT